MQWHGHVGLGVLASSPLFAWLVALDRLWVAAAVVAGAALFGVLPDADEFLSIPHRGPTHTVWFVIGVPAVVGAVLSVDLVPAPVPVAVPGSLLATGFATSFATGSDPLSVTGAIVIAITAALSLASHLAGDVLTPMGLRPFAPLSDWHVSLNVTLSKAPTVNRLLFVAGALAMAVPIVFLR